MFDKVQDSGSRQHFSTGSVRDTRDGKGRYDLLPPVALARIARHYENGAKKYGDRNWEKGQHLSRYIDSALRHAFKYLEGHQDEDHLAAACWNLMAIMHTQAAIDNGTLPEELGDMPWQRCTSPDPCVATNGSTSTPSSRRKKNSARRATTRSTQPGSTSRTGSTPARTRIK